MPVPDWEVEGTMEHAQRIALERALVDERYSVARAALRLRIGRSTTYRLIKKYRIAVDGTPPVAERRQLRTSDDAPRPAGGSEIVFDGTNFLLVRR